MNTEYYSEITKEQYHEEISDRKKVAFTESENKGVFEILHGNCTSIGVNEIVKFDSPLILISKFSDEWFMVRCGF